MIDVHSHLIYGVDDGPSSIKESIKMVLEAEKIGITKIIATPHFHKNLYDAREANENFQEIVLRTAGCGVDLYMGYEVFLTSNIVGVVRKKQDLRLNGSKYLLIELPFNSIPEYSYKTIYNLHLDNIIPILAHPERNRSFIHDIDKFISLTEKGCLVQVDAASVIGVYGANIKKFAKKLIKLNLVHFIASDAHCADDYSDWYLPAYQKVKRWAGREYADNLFCNNARKILSDT